MNSTPAASKTRRTAKSLATVSEVLPSASSARLIVLRPSADARARSSALHLRRARAARICGLVNPLAAIPVEALTHLGAYDTVRFTWAGLLWQICCIGG